ncbi:GNAT family N-acetyltransferase [Pseudogemmobacter faecipullorum]|uniref:GNAT family N-acetyltransferase n=1 Tax=Pseudogemmobacter faecipullorum TaxID=2755041 RepID=A0ABS8CGM2_9RHOB|nr:GNAT family N-acetyltransferase [Pseudogemmobacter faecipullorum]MCB5408542.1 GNAT family N-acetyltransferase [Pseudogemmobacter faecipullorum]
MTPAALAGLMEATWPPAATRRLGRFLLRDGAGGGKRVSAASLEGADLPDAADLRAAETAMEEPLFVVFPGGEAFDALLASRGYDMIDPVVAYRAPVAVLRRDLAPLATFAHWPPLEMVRDLWAEGGIGPARVRVMERVAGPHTAILARLGIRSAGAVFVACHGGEAMLHALEVTPAQRRRGAAGNLLAAAADWAAAQGAETLSLVVTERNLAARALYERAGMVMAGKYHYRLKKHDPGADPGR